MTCDEADGLLAAYAMGNLDDVAPLRRHLEGCPRCRAQGAAYVAVADLLAVAPDEVEPPEGLRDRIMASVHSDVARPAPRALGSPLRRVWSLVPAGRLLTLVGALAAAAAVALAVWSFAVPHGSGAPVSTTATDCGPASGPATSCTLEYDPATHSAVLTVRGLQPPASAPGTPSGVVEVWLIPSSGPPRAAAFLDEAPGGGEWTAALTADLSTYSVVAATLEPPGGSSQPTGRVLLRFNLPRLAGSA